ncbi:MAG: hypothetical protein R2820_14300 [Cyclobacteriaceae bacterium]|nr:hypothetical protein [Cyclobacteriaceae bacterium]
MDIQFWIWIIVIVITLIARANKKRPGQQSPPEDYSEPPQPQSTSRQPKAVTFEDLLREIQGQKTLSKPVPPPAPKKEYDFVDYDDDIKDEVEDLEDVDYNATRDDEVFKTYEAAKKQAFNRPSLEEVNPVGEVVRFDHFKEYDTPRKKKPSLTFLKELKDPNGFKKAFIMSEIIRRKY